MPTRPLCFITLTLLKLQEKSTLSGSLDGKRRYVRSQFGDLDMMVEIFFENDGATKKGGIDFEIGDMGTSAHLFRGLGFK